MLYLITAVIWFGLFIANIFSEYVSNRVNYGIASGLLTYTYFHMYLEKAVGVN